MGKVKSVPVIMQMEVVECGAASLGMILAYHKKWLPLEQLRKDCGALQTIEGYADLATLQDRYVHTQNEDIEAARSAIDGMFHPLL